MTLVITAGVALLAVLGLTTLIYSTTPTIFKPLPNKKNIQVLWRLGYCAKFRFKESGPTATEWLFKRVATVLIGTLTVRRRERQRVKARPEPHYFVYLCSRRPYLVKLFTSLKQRIL